MPESTRATWREAPPSFDAGKFPAALVEHAQHGWQRLYVDERDSLVAASEVMGDLARLGAPDDLLEAAARVVEDEVRHTRVCAHVVKALGGAPADVPAEQTRGHMEGPIAERLARMCIIGFAVGESMSAGCFAAAREHCHEPIATWAYTELLRDESRHGGFGADAGAFALTACPAEFAPSLWPAAVAEMEGIERRVGGPYDREKLLKEAAYEDGDTLERLGLLRGSKSCDAFHHAIERWVVPRLRELGVVA